MARDILDLGADVFDDTIDPKKRRISPKKRNYIIGLSAVGLFLAGAITFAVIAANTWLLDMTNLTGLQFYYTPKDATDPNAKEPTLTLYKLDSSIEYPSSFRIPEKVQGYKVTAIAPQAFNNHKEIKEVIFTSYIDTIGEKAFAGCSNIENFRWNNAINYIGKGAFDDTKYFKDLKDDPYDITRIPSGILINIGVDYLKNIGTGENLALVSDTFNIDNLVDKVKIDKYGIPNQNVIKFSDLSDQSEGETTGFIAGLFQNNQRISFIEMPEFLTQLGEETFKGCKNLKYVDFSQSQITSISKGNFTDCTSLSEIYFSDTLTELGDRAFENTQITELPDLDNITTFGNEVFNKCSKLETVYYPNTPKLTKVPNGMFKQCTSLKEFHWGDDDNGGEYIQSIGVGAFQQTALEEFYVPKTVSIIHDSAFESCTSLKKLYLYGNPIDEYNEQTIAKDENGVYQYAQGESEGRFDLANFDTELTISLGDREAFNVTADEDGNYIFEITNPSENIKLPSASFTLDNENFQYIKKAIIKERSEEEDVPSEETSAEEEEGGDEEGGDTDDALNVVIQDSTKFFSLTFSQDINTKEFVLSLKSTKTYTLDTNGVYHLGYLMGVNDIRKQAFYKCSNLSTIRLYGEDFDDLISPDNVFTFPKSLMLLNRSVQGFGVMSTFSNTAATSIYIDSYTQEIGDRAFRKIEGLSEVKFSENASLVSIGDAAFADNPLIEEIKIPNSVKTILAGAFENDISLTTIDIKNSKITTVTEALFANCISLTHIDLPETLTQIKKNAFDTNESLDYVVVPAAVNTLEASSFVKCANDDRGNLPIYLSMTSSKYNASASINKKFHDNTCDHYFLLEPGEEKQEGLLYWNGDASNPQVI